MSELRAVAGRPIYIEATLARNSVPVDTSTPGFKAWFTVKESKEDDDSEAIVALTQGAGITLDYPASAPNNLLTVTIGLDDTLAFIESSDLYWDLVIDDPASARGPETIDQGVLKLTAPVTRVVG